MTKTFNFDDYEIRFENMVLYQLFLNEDYRQKAMTILKQEYFDPPMGDFPYNIIFNHTKIIYDAGYEISPAEVYNSIQENENKLDEDDLKAIKKIFKSIGSMYDNDLGYINDIDVEYILNETEIFCKEVAVEIALMESINIIEENSKEKGKITGLLEDALSVGFESDNGSNYFKNPADRFNSYKEEEDKIRFSIPMLNYVTNNGFPKGTLNCFMAGTGIGKTLIMTSLAVDYIKNGFNVLYVTLEISEKMIMMRSDANLLDIPMSDLAKKVNGEDVVDVIDLQNKFKSIEKKYDMGDFRIKQYPTGGVSTLNIKSLLKELKSQSGFEPDVIFVDYINLINSYRMSGKNSNSYSIVKASAEELRGLAVESNTIVITATQVNRDGISGDEVGLDKVSESAGLPHTTDFFAGAYQTEQQRASGIIILKPLKNRYSSFVNTKHALGISYDHMRIYQLDQDDYDDALEQDDSTPPDTSKGTAFNHKKRRR